MIADRQHDDGEQPLLGERQQHGLAGRTADHRRAGSQVAQQVDGDVVRAVVDLRWRGGIGEHGADSPHRRVEHRGQRLQIAVGARGDELLGDELVFGRRHLARLRLSESEFRPGTSCELAAGAHRTPDRLGDGIEGNAEDVMQHERDPLAGAQSAQHLP